MTESDEESRHWVAANAHAGLGLPITRGERHRLVKRVVVRLGRPFLRHQVEYNRALLAELVTIRDSLVAQTIALGASTTEHLAALVERVDALGVRLDELGASTTEQLAALIERVDVLGARLDELGVRLDGLGVRLDEQYSSLLEEGSVDRELVHEEVELAQQHALEHIREACDDIRGELRDLARQTEKRQQELKRASGRVR